MLRACFINNERKSRESNSSRNDRFVSRVALARIVTLGCDARVYVWFDLMMNDDSKILALNISYPTSPKL